MAEKIPGREDFRISFAAGAALSVFGSSPSFPLEALQTTRVTLPSVFFSVLAA